MAESSSTGTSSQPQGRLGRLVLYPEFIAEEGSRPLSVGPSFDAERRVFYNEIDAVYVYRTRDWGASVHMLWGLLFAILAVGWSQPYWLLAVLAAVVYVCARIFVWQSEVARIVSGHEEIQFRIDRPKHFRDARRFFLTLLALAHRATDTPWDSPEAIELPADAIPEPRDRV